MRYIGRPIALFCKARLKFAAATILTAMILIPAKAEENLGAKRLSVGTAYASAKIHNRFEVRPESFADLGNSVDKKISDVSLRDCDAELQQMFKNCVLMIYEIQ